MDVQLIIDDVALTDKELRVGYVLHNREPRDLYVYNLLSDRHGQLGGASNIPTSELVQTCLLPPHTLYMLLGIVPRNVNPRASYFAPLFPDCSKIEAGRAYAATLRAKLPLAEWSEYAPPNREGQPVVVTELRLDAYVMFADELDWVRQHPISTQAWVARGKIHRVSVTATIAEHNLVIHKNAAVRPFPT